MNHSGHAYQMQGSPAMNLSPANVKKGRVKKCKCKKAALDCTALCYCDYIFGQFIFSRIDLISTKLPYKTEGNFLVGLMLELPSEFSNMKKV